MHSILDSPARKVEGRTIKADGKARGNLQDYKFTDIA
jgi:hypothetical protein